MSTDVEMLPEMAKLAEQAERYEDMKQSMVEFVEKHGDADLTVEQRNLISVAFKNIVGGKRSAHRILNSVYAKEQEERRKKTCADQAERVWVELKDVCNEMLKLLDKYLIPNAKTGESKVFYMKMKGDYERYLAEGAESKSSEKAGYVELSSKAYQEASDIANADLATTHPIRLGLALNYSVFFYEIVNKPDEACKLAKEAFENAIQELDTLEESDYKDSTLILQLLRDNLTLWTSGDGQEEQQQQDED